MFHGDRCANAYLRTCGNQLYEGLTTIQFHGPTIVYAHSYDLYDVLGRGGASKLRTLSPSNVRSNDCLRDA